MKIYILVKGNETVTIGVGKTKGQMKRRIGDKEDTSVIEMTPLEANRKVNELLRQGYATKK
jgi:hypothetical protein